MPIPHPRLCSESLSSLPGDQSLHGPHTQGMKSGETREAGVHTVAKGGGTSLLLSFAELYRLPSFPFKLCLTRSVWRSCPFLVMLVSPKKSKWGALVSKVSRSSPYFLMGSQFLLPRFYSLPHYPAQISQAAFPGCLGLSGPWFCCVLSWKEEIHHLVRVYPVPSTEQIFRAQSSIPQVAYGVGGYF